VHGRTAGGAIRNRGSQEPLKAQRKRQFEKK